MTRIALGLQYDGRAWHGWQSQPDRKTVQDELESALSRFANRPVRTTCAGRTDTGVHALGQVVHFDTDASRTQNGWVRGVNALLPPSIAVTWSAPVEERFDARFDAIGRTYHYLLLNQPTRSPHWTGRAGWTHAVLDLDAMNEAAAALVGTHDFSSFRSSECQAKSPIKTMDAVRIERSGDFVRFTFEATAFLHHMVRNLVGTLIAIGRGRHGAAWLRELIEARDRTRAAPTFMPDGLYLAQVRYPERIVLPPPVAFAQIHAGFPHPSS